MRRKLTVALAIIFLINSINFFKVESAPALPNEDSFSPWAFDTLKVGYVKRIGFLREDSEGHLSGYGYEYMEFLEMYAHCRFEYVGFDQWDELVEAFENREVDLVPGMPGDYRQLTNGKRTSHVIGRFPMEFVVRNREIKPHMKIGTLTMSYPTPFFPSLAIAEGFTYDEISFSQYVPMLEAYQNGEIDGYVDALFNFIDVCGFLCYYITQRR